MPVLKIIFTCGPPAYPNQTLSDTLEDVQRIPSPARSRISQYRVILSSRSIPLRHFPLHPSPIPRSSLRTRHSSPYLCFSKPANGQSSPTLFVGRSIFELIGASLDSPFGAVGSLAYWACIYHVVASFSLHPLLNSHSCSYALNLPLGNMDTPILNLTSPPRYDHPPPFSSLSYDLPTYARTAAADERILISEPLASVAASAGPREYVYESKWLRLNLGPKVWPIKAPCYGWNATVEGYVDVPDLARARAVRLTVAVSNRI